MELDMSTPSELLKAASADIDAGCLREGAELAYQAAPPRGQRNSGSAGFPFLVTMTPSAI